jgi:hypothetical protein
MRMALGAEPRTVVGLVLRQAARHLLPGRGLDAASCLQHAVPRAAYLALGRWLPARHVSTAVYCLSLPVTVSSTACAVVSFPALGR